MVGFFQDKVRKVRDARMAAGVARTPEATGAAPPPVAMPGPVAPTQDPALHDGLLGAVRGARQPRPRRGLSWNPARGQFELEGY
jgi:hypothetical protein